MYKRCLDSHVGLGYTCSLTDIHGLHHECVIRGDDKKVSSFVHAAFGVGWSVPRSLLSAFFCAKLIRRVPDRESDRELFIFKGA